MRTEAETWGRATFQADLPPDLGTLDGREVLDRGREHRRRQRVLGAAGLVLGAGLWAGGVLPGSPAVLPLGAGADDDWRTTCPVPAEGAASYDAGSPYGTYTVVDEVPDVEPLLAWTTSTGIRVTVLPTLGPCLAPAPREDVVGVAVLARPPGGPTVLVDVQDVEARTAEHGAAHTGSGWLEGGVAILPPGAVEVRAAQAEVIGELVPVRDEAGTVAAQVAQVRTGDHGQPPALLWQEAGEGPPRWSIAWVDGDLRVRVDDETASAPTSARPQLNRTGVDGSWWLWMGGPDVAGPVSVPTDGPWVLRVSDGEHGSGFVGWVPEGSEAYLVDGDEPTTVLPMTTVEVAAGDPDPAQGAPGLMPVVVEDSAGGHELAALAADGARTPVRVIDVELLPAGDGQG